MRENIEAASFLPAGERGPRVVEMLALARAMVDRPRLLCSISRRWGLATAVVREVRQRLEALAKDGVAIVIADWGAATQAFLFWAFQ